MIKKLLIQNYALIEALELEFPSGLTIITGETGAGKSILLGALGLIMGNRADSRSLFDENKKCVVEAYFSIEKYGLASFFENNEIAKWALTYLLDDEDLIYDDISIIGWQDDWLVLNAALNIIEK